MRRRANWVLVAIGLLAGCADAPTVGAPLAPAEVEEECAFWELQAEYQIEERLDGMPANVRRMSATFGGLTTRERFFLRNLINHVWALPLDSLETTDYPQEVRLECRRRYRFDGRF